eukprot:229587_1
MTGGGPALLEDAPPLMLEDAPYMGPMPTLKFEHGTRSFVLSDVENQEDLYIDTEMDYTESSNSRPPDPPPDDSFANPRIERLISPSDDFVLSSSLRSLGLLPMHRINLAVAENMHRCHVSPLNLNFRYSVIC